MDFTARWRQAKAFWSGAWSAYVDDVRRLDAASRPLAFAVVFLGGIVGLVPVGLLVALFRLTDALFGARSVRVLTSDLREALLTAGVVWMLATCAAVGRTLLRGVAARIAARTANIAAPLSLLICMFLVMPLRALSLAGALAIAEAWPMRRGIRIGSTLFVAAVGFSGIATVLDYLLARAISVGSFLLFAGIIAGFTTWFAFRRIVPSASYAHHR